MQEDIINQQQSIRKKQTNMAMVISLLVVIVILGVGAYIFMGKKIQSSHLTTQQTTQPTAIPSTAQLSREEAKKLPKDKCLCWDQVHSVCLPTEDCR